MQEWHGLAFGGNDAESDYDFYDDATAGSQLCGNMADNMLVDDGKDGNNRTAPWENLVDMLPPPAQRPWLEINEDAGTAASSNNEYDNVEKM